MALEPDSIGKLGFGLMRLPKIGQDIDIEQTKQMVDMFMAAGFTYFDTAWAYDGSEEATRRALVERYPRESFQLATKCAAWIDCDTREDAVAQFRTSLERTGAGFFDFYLLHNLGEGRTAAFDRFGMWDWIDAQKAEGAIRHAGFSFHSTPKELDALLSAHPEVDFVQLQINYADWENPAVESRACYEVARGHGKPIVVMEPVKGGLLARPPRPVLDILAEADPKASPASWAIRFAANLPGVITVLSGMSDIAQMEDNLSFMRGFHGLTAQQEQTISRARAALEAIPIVPCTTCDYCAKVCPRGVGVSGTFTAANMLTLYGNLDRAKSQERWLVERHGRASATECIECGACERACPQHIAIRTELARAIEALGLDQP
ncbi:MAG: aldo/keto reductase [Collinsella sp.]|nr:aldo/keto reductase [Collinsella sp.]